ncbi:MAG: DUF1636 family protein [Hyphomicrobiaceae bacterium]
MTTPTPSGRITLHVCTTCRRGDEPLGDKKDRSGYKLFEAVQEQLGQRQDVDAIDLIGVECLSGCSRGCTIAVSGDDKWTFVIGDLDPEKHAEDIVTYARQHGAHEEGLPTWRERPEAIRKGVLARVPAITLPTREAAE